MTRLPSIFVMSRFPARAFSALFFGLTASASLLAQDTATTSAPLPTPVAVPAAPVAETPLTLEECIALAMKKNFDLQIQGYSTDIARESLIIAKADYLPTLTASTNRALNRSTALIAQPDGTTLLIPRDSNSTSFSVGASERIPQTNGVFSVSGNASRSSIQRPPFNSGVSAAISQPLLKNAGPTAARSDVDRSKLGLGIAYLNYRSRVLTVIRDTENAYYNLVGARETLRIRQLTLDYNQNLFEENKTRRATGVATDLDVLTAEYGVANARRAFVQAEQGAHDREDALFSLINMPNFDVRPGLVAFEDYTLGTVSFATSYKLARDNFPDTLSTEETIKQLELDVATAKQNRLPSLNLNASLGYNTTDQSYGDVITSLPNNHGDSRTLSLSYSMPWGMKADRARYRTAIANRDEQKARLDQLEMSLVVQVRTFVRAVEANAVAVEIAVKATELAARKYDLEKARFDAGLSTSRLVLQAQDDLENERFNELSAKVTLRSAIAELQRLEGTSIKRFGVQLPE